MNWRLAPMIGLVAVLAPAMAHAQTNLDQGKSASQIFAAACVECHKAPRGLAKGKNSAALTDFLRRALHDQPRTGGSACRLRAGWPWRGARRGRSARQGSKAGGRAGRTRARPRQRKPKPSKTPGAAVQTRGGRPYAKPSRTRSLRSSRRSNSCRANGRQRRRRGVGAGNRRRRSPRWSRQELLARLLRLWQSPRQARRRPAEASPAPTPTPETSTPGDAASGESAPVPRDNIPD